MKKIIIRIIKYINRKLTILLSYLGSKSGSRHTLRHNYKDYNKYVNFQKEKSTNQANIDKWMNEEWLIKLKGFNEIFNRSQEWIEGKGKGLCLGARTGQEVKSLLDLGINSIGIDLVPFPPYTIEGDIHNLKYKPEEFDLIFTNIVDHSIHPDIFCKEMERVCMPGGIIIINLQLWTLGDKYTESVIYDSQAIIDMFKSVAVKVNKRISNSHDSMNWELVLEKV
jgi:SAM-dependent methyltransferase